MTFPLHYLRARARRLLLPALLGSSALLATGCLSHHEEATAVDNKAADEAAIKKYIATHALTTAQRQPSGLYLVPDSVAASQPLIKAGQKVTVVYTGQLLDGQVFDSNAEPGGTPFTFTVGADQVIAGWDLGLALLHKGDKARLLIPSALGYGPDGNGPIPGGAVLLFSVRVTDVQ